MPELDESIVNWRERIAGGGVIDPQTLEELESHLRDEVAALCAAGVPGEVAFDAAAWRIGMPGALQREFSKVRYAWLPISIAKYGWLAITASVPLLMLVKYTPGRVGPVLMAHILTITAGYLGAIMIGIMGAAFALFRQAGAMSPAREQATRDGVTLLSRIAAVMIAAGFVLGMVWSYQNLGQLWSNDPREIGGVVAALWFVAMALIAGWRIRVEMLAALAIGGSLIVTLAWVAAGLMIAARNPLTNVPLNIALGLHIALILLVLIPARATKTPAAASDGR